MIGKALCVRGLPLAVLLTALVSVIGCSGDPLKFGGGLLNDENDNVTVMGDVDDTLLRSASGAVTAAPAGRDIVVFVYTDLRCCNADFTPETSTPFRSIDFTVAPFDTVELSDLTFVDVESVILAGGSGAFQVGDITNGDLTVLMLLDGTEPDGTAETGDPIAVVTDPDNELVDVRTGRTVTLEAVDVTFAGEFPGGDGVAKEITLSGQASN